MSTAITRQIVLDTETTGMNQIGALRTQRSLRSIAVEVVNRRLTGTRFHVYLAKSAGGSKAFERSEVSR